MVFWWCMSGKAFDPREIAEDAAKKLADAEAQFAKVAAQTDAVAAFASYALVRLWATRLH